MNTVSISRAIEKATGLKKSEKQKDYTRDSGSGNVAYRLQRVDRWRNGDFHIAKYYQNSYDLYLDNVDATKKGDDIVKVLEDLGCTNIIPHIDRKWIRFDIPTENKVMNGYERNADSLNVIFNSREVIKSARNFDDVELQILFDNIVGGQDEGFFDWYSDKYGDIPWDNMKSIPKDRIAEYVNENPDILSEMEYEINISYQDYSAGNTLDKNVNDYLSNSKRPIKSSFEHLEEYVSSDSFAESSAFDDYIMDKLIERGFSNDEIEFGWYDPEVKNAREEIDRNFNMDDYVKWCENYISSDKYKYMWYQDWLRANNYPSDYDKPLSERYSFDPAKNTFPGTGRF